MRAIAASGLIAGSRGIAELEQRAVTEIWATLVQVIEILSRIVDLIGIGVIFWGVGAGLASMATARRPRATGKNDFDAINRVRGKVGSHILLGLEILIASDIAATVVEPSYDRLLLLGAIVAIRTVLGFFLSRELESIAAASEK